MASLSWSLSDKRIAAIYSSKEEVFQAKRSLETKLADNSGALRIVQPSNEVDNTTLSARPEGLGKTMLQVHIIYAVVSILVGIGSAWALVTFGPEFTQLNPVFTYIAMISPGLFIGLFLSGFVSLQPQRDNLNMNVKQAVEANKWALLIMLNKTKQKQSDVLKMLKQTDPDRIV